MELSSQLIYVEGAGRGSRGCSRAGGGAGHVGEGRAGAGGAKWGRARGRGRTGAQH